MSDEDILNLIDASLLSDDAPPVTDAEVETFLSAPINRSPSVLRRMRKQFAAKVFEALHPEPVRRVESGLRFGDWIQSTREDARLTRKAVGEALGKDQAYVERLEREETLLWKLAPSKAADIVTLFRIHIDAVAQLLSASFTVVRDKEEIRKIHEQLARGGTTSPTDSYAALISPDERRTSSQKPESASRLLLNEEITRFLENLRDALEKRNATHLL